MLTLLSTLSAAAVACSSLHINELRPAQVMACVLEPREGSQTCDKRDDSVQRLFELQNAQVTRLLFSLSARTDEVSVRQALRGYEGSELPETRCDNRRIASGRRWAVPVASSANGDSSTLEVHFVGGKVASARWHPAPTLIFQASYIMFVGGGWRPPPESAP